MSKENNGGSAFPNGVCDSNSGAYHIEDGMSLRDYFAAKANENDIKHYMKELESITNGIAQYKYRNRIEARYAFADAMLAERDK